MHTPKTCVYAFRSLPLRKSSIAESGDIYKNITKDKPVFKNTIRKFVWKQMLPGKKYINNVVCF